MKNFVEFSASSYFHCTYRDPQSDRAIKQGINQYIQSELKDVKITNIPNKRKIAVISSSWWNNHVVYRNCYSLLSSLKNKYHLTLFHFGKSIPDASLFNELRIITGEMTLDNITVNDYAAIIYPDVGMRPETIFLSNLQIAPIQITAVGHPVSTYGSKITHYVTGQDTEEATAQKHYSEKLVRIPGLGFGNQPIRYERKGIRRSEFVINCTANKKKWNLDFVNTLGRIFKSVKRPVTLQIFCGTEDKFPWVPDLQVLNEVLKPAKLLFRKASDYDTYMEQQEGASLNLDSFHFGGCNTVCDSLHLGIPMLCLEGDRLFNRNGTACLKKAQVSELVANSKENYVEKAIRLIEDDRYRDDIVRKINTKNLFNTEPDLGFREFVDKEIARI